MKLFGCAACKSVVFFESVRCETCGRTLAFLPDLGDIGTLEPAAEAGVFVAIGDRAGDGARYRLCANSVAYQLCNWAVPAEAAEALCRSCGLDETIPNLGEPGALAAWRALESAKRRLVFTLDALGLPLDARFAFLSGPGVVTGHADGLVTINIAEADAAFRERVRAEMHETYRTVLGHLRHEIGHYYWLRLIAGDPLAFRSRFGDERADYAAARRRHYADGPPVDWMDRHVSAYASVHPWEDWAETWAHYLHMVDTLQTARSYGLALRPRASSIASVVAKRLDFDDFDDLIGAWIPLTLALNSLNRSMGLPDLYPFVLSADAIAKLRFVHETASASTVSPRNAM